jgi:hypothetical protein
VFAARAGSRSEWRFVPLTEGDLSDDRLAMLGCARCTTETARHLPDNVKALLYELWGRAREAILVSRGDELDPTKRLAAVPKAQRDAVALLYGATAIEEKVLARTIEALQVPWPVTVARELRGILDQPSVSPSAKAEQVVAFVAAEGLHAPQLPAEPAITADDVHMVCYQVVST